MQLFKYLLNNETGFVNAKIVGTKIKKNKLITNNLKKTEYLYFIIKLNYATIG